MGIDTSYYGKYERGVHPLPVERLIFRCKFYNVSADYILGLPEICLSRKGLNFKYPSANLDIRC